MGVLGFIQAAMLFILKVWGWASGRSKKKLQNDRRVLESASRQALLDGDLNETRRVRAEIEEIDRRLERGDY